MSRCALMSEWGRVVGASVQVDVPEGLPALSGSRDVIVATARMGLDLTVALYVTVREFDFKGRPLGDRPLESHFDALARGVKVDKEVRSALTSFIAEALAMEKAIDADQAAFIAKLRAGDDRSLSE